MAAKLSQEKNVFVQMILLRCRKSLGRVENKYSRPKTKE